MTQNYIYTVFFFSRKDNSKRNEVSPVLKTDLTICIVITIEKNRRTMQNFSDVPLSLNGFLFS